MTNKANKKRIVVVDSNPIVREMLPDFLNDAGYSVYARETPSQVKTDLDVGVAVDAIITGLHFHGGFTPGMMLVEWLKTVHPKIKIIVSTEMPDFCPKGIRCVRKPHENLTVFEILREEGV